MLKKFAAVLALVLMMGGVAAADRKQFTDFSVDLAPGWEAREDTDPRGLKTVIITHPAQRTTLIIGVEPLNGLSLKDTAAKLAAEVHSQAEPAGDGVYVIVTKGANGQVTVARLTAAGEKAAEFLGVAVTGDVNDPDVGRMMNSVK